MNILEIIDKKRNGEALSLNEIEYVVSNYTNSVIADYQMSSFLMAVTIKGMNSEEISNLTMCMKNTGKSYDFKNIQGIKLDKHSTGGVSDTTTLAILPIMASLGYKFPKMSGRSLGYTGGTIDKLEVFKGINLALNEKQFDEILNKVGCCITAQTNDIAVADKKIYALRDASGTVSSLALIASSIMSKKLAFKTDCLILDVKFGEGALLTKKTDATKLARLMVEIGKNNNHKTMAIISNMNYPLGNGIGNNLEIYDVIEILNGVENNLSYVVKFICSLYLTEFEHISYKQALCKINDVINTKKALTKFKEMIVAEGGEINVIENPSLLLNYNNDKVLSDKCGFITKIDALKLAKIVLSLGGGRIKKDDIVNNEVGIKIKVNINQKVNVNDELCSVFSEKITNELKSEILSCFEIKNHRIAKPKLIYKVIK